MSLRLQKQEMWLGTYPMDLVYGIPCRHLQLIVTHIMGTSARRFVSIRAAFDWLYSYLIGGVDE